MTNKHYSFTKQERIVSRKLTDELFGGKGSHRVTAFPVKGLYCVRAQDNGDPVQVLISVPKRYLKHAVDRNRVKRQVKEAYRLNRQRLVPYVPDGQTVSLAFIWMASQLLTTAEVEKRIIDLLDKIAKKLHA